uniref:Glycosyltransferase n=1 Tax=Syphacia muris TaxID=451379 RepID=A0A0N5AU09_9BILA
MFQIHFGAMLKYINTDCCETHQNISVARDANRIDIAIVTVLKNGDNYDNYKLAQDLFHCYAIYHNYSWLVIDVSSNKTLQRLCPQNDYIKSEWILFIDADMCVINPNHLIEEWIDDNYSIIFYLRTFNFEVAAGSYLVKNTPYSRKFLSHWANYEKNLPNSYHGSDNGAIHSVMMDMVQPEKLYEKKQCEKFWKEARYYWISLWTYEACIQYLLGANKSWLRKVKILNKTKSWVRDVWLTNSVWSNEDFVLHGWQMRKLNKAIFAGWELPLTSDTVNLSSCSTDKAYINWAYKKCYMKSQSEVQALLSKTIDSVDSEYEKTLNREVLRFLKK